MTTNVFRINGVDFSDIIEHNSYVTRSLPELTKIRMISKKDYVVHDRDRGFISFKTNNMTQERYIALCEQLAPGVCDVTYTCLQTGEVVTQEMTYDDNTANFIGNCQYLNKQWIAPVELTFEET